MLARIAPAVLLPVFWGVGSDAAGQIVSGRNTGKAISQVYFGVTAALLFGLPAGTLLGDAFGWRGAFWLLAALSLLVPHFDRYLNPASHPEKNESFTSQITVLRSRYFLCNLLLSLAVFSAMFGAYTYLADMLEKVAGVAPSSVGWWLMGFGAVGLMGNYIAGVLVDKHAVKAGVIFCLLLGSGSALAVLFVHNSIIFIPSLIAWGIAHTALFPLCQIRVINAAESGKALAGTMNISACNSGIALGAVAGGWLIGISGITAAILGASVLIFVCAIAYPWVDRMKCSSSKVMK